MKKALKPLVAVAMLATVAFAANVENPLYAPAPLGFYSKTGFSSMYKQSDANLAMQAKDWEHEREFPIWRIYEDFGLGLTDRFAIRGAFGYTHDGAIDRSGPHNARLGLNYRGINQPVEAVVWDLYMDAWLGGISKMKANLIASSPKTPTYPLTFKYDNYANGRWGVWVGTVVGKTFDKLTVSAFGEFQKTFGNNNNQIKIDTSSANPIIRALVKQGVYPDVYKKVSENLPAFIGGVCEAKEIPPVYCNKEALGDTVFGLVEQAARGLVEDTAQVRAKGIAAAYAAGLPDDFNVDTKGAVDYVAGFKTSYDINSNWSVGGGFTWRHRGTNEVEKVNITNTSKNLDSATIAAITNDIGGKLGGSLKDGVEEYTITLLGSRQFTKNLQLTLFGEYTFDTAEEKAQLGSDIRAEVGLRMNWQF